MEKQKRVAVLCGHEPTLDPRITWLVNKLVDEGHEVRLVGTASERPKTDDPVGLETFRVDTVAYDRHHFSNLDLSLEHMGIGRVYLYALLGIPVLLNILYRLLVAPVVTLVYLLEKVPGVRRLVAEFEVLLLRTRWQIRKIIDHITNRAATRVQSGLIGYKWYLHTHALRYAIGARELLCGDWQPEIVVANDPDTLLAGSLLKNQLGCRFVYDAHEFGPDAYLMEPSPRQIFHAYERIFMANVDAAMTVTPQIQAEFRRVYENSPEFVVLPNATPRHLRETSDDMFEDMERLGEGKIRFLFQGGFAANRGVEELIEEFAQSELDNAVLFIRGPNNPYRQTLLEHRNKLPYNTDNIHFLDSIGEDKLIDSAMHADVGLITYLSHIENHQGACPNKLSQYMQAGIFVLSSNLPFVRGVISESGAGEVYDDQTPGALSSRLKALASDTSQLKEAGLKGKSFAETRFCYEYYFDDVRQVLFAD